jgi:hypothetical protein
VIRVHGGCCHGEQGQSRAGGWAAKAHLGVCVCVCLVPSQKEWILGHSFTVCPAFFYHSFTKGTAFLHLKLLQKESCGNRRNPAGIRSLNVRQT